MHTPLNFGENWLTRGSYGTDLREGVTASLGVMKQDGVKMVVMRMSSRGGMMGLFLRGNNLDR